MKFGLFSIGYGACVFPETAARVARAAQAAGFESLWTGERVVAPDPQVPPSPAPADFPVLDPLLALTWAAAHTTTMKLGTGVILLPQRNPLVLAKEIASLDMLSGGRLIFGIGSGYLKPEFDALNVAFDHRVERSEEYLRAMVALWTMERPEFHGRHFSYGGVNTAPRPAQQPHPPVAIGGHSRRAFDLTARLGQGWYGFGLDLNKTAEHLAGLKAACESNSRRFDDIEISVTPAGAIDRDSARRYQDLGVHRLILPPPTASESNFLQFIATAESNLLARM